MSTALAEERVYLLGAMELSVDEEAPRRARRELARLLAKSDGVQREKADECGLLLSEVVTNVVEHAAKSACPVVRVLWVRVGNLLCTEVYDSDPRLPASQVADLDDEGGRGLWLVDVMADLWGSELQLNGGKVVWFTVSDVWTG